MLQCPSRRPTLTLPCAVAAKTPGGGGVGNVGIQRWLAALKQRQKEAMPSAQGTERSRAGG